MRVSNYGGMLADWRYPLSSLRAFIANYKIYNKSIDLDILEQQINNIELGLVDYDKYQILNLLNNEHISKKKNYSSYINDLIRHQANLIEGSKHYSQLIITAGYATFFGLWSQTDMYLNQFEKIWSITLLAISATIFVFHEVFSMLINSLDHDVRNKALLKAKIEDTYEKGNNIMDEAERYGNALRLFQHNAWKYFFGSALLTGLASVLILLYSYIGSFWNIYQMVSI